MLRFLFLALVLALRCPTSGRCPPDTDIRTGIRRWGVYACWPTPVPAPHQSRQAYLDYDGTYLRPERSIQPSPHRIGWIFCVPGTQPVVLDARSVTCAPCGPCLAALPSVP